MSRLLSTPSTPSGSAASLAAIELNRNLPERRREALIVVAIILLAFAIRLPALLGDGLWRDEANIYVQLSAPNFAEFFGRVMATEWHPPLYFLIIYCWTKVAGISEFMLEIVPFLFSVATAAVIYRLGKSMASIATGAIAAILYAVAPIAITYSSEYVYPLMGFLSTLLAWLVVRSRQQPMTFMRFARLASVSFLVVFTHYTALIYVPLLALWAMLYQTSVRERICIACALVAGAVPFIFWLPVFMRQRQIGVPYNSATTVAQKLGFLLRSFVDFIPVRSTAFEAAFAALIFVALIALIRARMIRRDVVGLASIFVMALVAVAFANLLVERYVLAFYGLACVFLGWVLARFGAQLNAADRVGWRRWGAPTAAFLGLALVVIDFTGAIAASRTPKSGIRSIVHLASLDATTFYVIAPDYLASTFTFYARDTHATFAGFVRWDRPEIFRLEGYAADWNRSDAIDRALAAIATESAGDSVLDLVVDDRVRNQGQLPYGIVHLLLRKLATRYLTLDQIQHPGRFESVSEYRFRLRRL